MLWQLRSRKIIIPKQNKIKSFQVTLATGLGKVVTQIQLERSEVAFFIFTNGSTLRLVDSNHYFIIFIHSFDVRIEKKKFIKFISFDLDRIYRNDFR